MQDEHWQVIRFGGYQGGSGTQETQVGWPVGRSASASNAAIFSALKETNQNLVRDGHEILFSSS
jgi:hypothetical protein